MSRSYPDRPIVGVGVVAFRGETVLLIRRSKPPRVGQWSLPGGMQELGETLEEAARRELREETGMSTEAMDFLTTVDLIERDADGRVRFHYTLVDFWAELAPGEPVAGADEAAAALLPLRDVAGLGLWTETLRIIELAQRRREAHS